MRAKILPLALAAAVLVGCGRLGSEKIATSSMFADITVTVDPSQGTTTASAVLSDSAEPLDLAGNDILFARAAGIDQVMGPTPGEEDDDSFRPYEAVLDVALDAEEITVAFERSVDGGAPETVFTTPASFSVIESEEAVSRSGVITLAWQPATTDGMRLLLTSGCLAQDHEFEVEDPAVGEYEIPADTLAVGSGSGDVCLVDVEVIRYRAGSLDPAVADGTAFAQTARSFVLETKAE